MKTLAEILKESLFDKDLVTRDVGVLDVIVSNINEYERGTHSLRDWEKCLKNIKKCISWDGEKGWSLTIRSAKIMEDDELYVNINIQSFSSSSLTLIGHNLTGMHQSTPFIIRIAFSPQIENIYLDIYSAINPDYKDILSAYKFNYYNINKNEVNNFIDNVYNKLESVF